MEAVNQSDGAGRQPSSTRGPFVGRERERAELAAGLDAALAGRGRLFLVGGESGIGKTRLAETVAEDAAERGGVVVWGSAWEAGGAPAYWPWVQVLRGLARNLAPDDLRADLGAGAPLVAQIAPPLRQELPELGDPPPLDSDAARFSAFDATTSFLRAVAARRPLLVVLDDLHAADVPTLLLLEFVARGLHGARILVLGTYRVHEAAQRAEAGDLLAGLGKGGGRLVLGGLDREAVGRLVAARAGPPAAERLVARVHELTEGNPLFVDEVMRLLVAEAGVEDAVRGRLPLPHGVRETIRRRLDPLSPDTIEILRQAAVIGREFRLDLLAEAGGGERGALLDHLDDALRAAIVEASPGEVGRYRFKHALIRETLYEALSAPHRVVLHRAVAEALARGDGEAHLSELAHHFLEAAAAGDPEPAIEYARRAGDRAMRSLAYEQAGEFYRGALSASRLSAPDEDRRGALLLALGEAQVRAGELATGRATLRQAAESARQCERPERLARAALASAPWGLSTGVVDEELVALLEDALQCLPGGDSALRARTQARLAVALYWSDAVERRQELIAEALATARRLGDPSTLAAVLLDAHLATWDPDAPTRSLPWAQEVIELAEQVGDVEPALHAHSARISLLLELGDLAAVDQEIEVFARVASELHQPRSQVYVPLYRAMRALIEGRYADAERHIAAGGELATRLQQESIVVMLVAAQLFVMRMAQGRLGELEPAVEHFANAYPAMPVWRCALTAVYRNQGRTMDERREYERLAAGAFAAIPRDNVWLPALALLAETAADLGDAEGAAVLAEMLGPYAGRNVITPDCGFFAPVDRYLGLLAAARGRLDEARERFAAARAIAERLSARPVLGQLAYDEAAALASTDPERARTCRTEALRYAEELGLEVLAARAAELEPRIGGAPAPATEEPAAPAVAPGRPSPPVVARLRREGEVWEIAFRGGSFHLKDAKGLHHLATLLARPGVEFHALDLVGAPAPAGASAPSARGNGDLVVRAAGEDDVGALLDARAKAEYKRRIEELREEIEEAESFHDPERARRAQEELEFIARELSAAVGLGGRDRKVGSSSERARVNVTRALKAAVDRIAAHDAALGHHLRSSVRTGTFCAYDPGPEAPTWEL